MNHLAHEIILSPSGRSFMVEADETILEAALRNGHSIRYQCSNGKCGDCRARIVRGEVADHLPYDYVFRGEDRTQPMILMCRALPATDMEIEIRHATSVEDIPQQEIPASVAHITTLRDDVVELRLKTPRSRPMRFMAGQLATLHLEGCAPLVKPIASCPCNGRELLFHFFRADTDPCTKKVFDQLKIGSKARVEGPSGNFVLQEPGGERIVFVAFGQGFAPVKSLIEHVLSLEVNTPVELLWLANNPGGHYMENQCRAWKDAISAFNYTLVEVPREDLVAQQPGSALDELLSSVLPDIDGADLYLAAPRSVIDAVTRLAGDRPLRSICLEQDAGT
jgi:CDP-4-dehydro-6-deoxyglucose reductase